ncbi:uncharacterized protein LOC129288260 [Prosopis cineraria]|uniref:uncharacterized protein LOC129288260 n=1 Tax=Prosopis cineraria TaxID=364024 RepID=UPI00240EFE59|nr:uncharacterized protein LOC129288260 [Prosopis cineraria]
MYSLMESFFADSNIDHHTMFYQRKLGRYTRTKKKLRRASFSIFSTITFFACIILCVHKYQTTSHDYYFLRCSLIDLQNPIPTKGTVTTLSRSIFLTSSNIPTQQVDEDDQKAPEPPLNLATKYQRINWFRKNLHEFKIFKSNNLTRQFHTRVVGFLSNEECEARFFMTWISPARLFGSRELLSLETLFKFHPQVCLIIVSITLNSKQGNKILRPLIHRGFKVQAVTPDLPSLFRKTPAKAWLHDLRKGKKDPGKIPLSQNLSNLIRLVILYKYGGIYLDTDFIVLKPFHRLRNSIAAQSMDQVSKNWTRLNNAVLVFDKNHPLVFRFIEEFERSFDGNKWGYNGPYMVSRVVERVREEGGLDFRVLPPTSFYPVDWKQVEQLFKKPRNEEEERWIEAKLDELKSGETYGIHLWNKQSKNLTIEEGSLLKLLISYHFS